MEAMVQKVTGVKFVTMHPDISTVTGEEVILFTLARSPGSCGASIPVQQHESGEV